MLFGNLLPKPWTYDKLTTDHSTRNFHIDSALLLIWFEWGLHPLLTVKVKMHVISPTKYPPYLIYFFDDWILGDCIYLLGNQCLILCVKICLAEQEKLQVKERNGKGTFLSLCSLLKHWLVTFDPKCFLKKLKGHCGFSHKFIHVNFIFKIV